MFARRSIIGRFVIFSVLALIMLNPSSGHTFRYLRPGMNAPDFTLVDFDGNRMTLGKSLGDKPLVLLFWASWSSRGLEELADLEEYRGHFAPAEFKVLAINADAQTISPAHRDSIRALAESLNLRHTFLWDDGLALFNEYGVIAVPSALLLDKTGRIRAAINGYSRSGRALLEDSLGKLLGHESSTATPELVTGYEPMEKARLHLNLGLRLLDGHKLKKAERELRRSCELDSGFAQSLLSLGEVLEKQGEDAEAREIYQRVLTLDSKSALALGRLGALTHRDGDTAGALEFLRRALDADDSYYPARLFRAEINIQGGDLEAARIDLKDARDANPNDLQLASLEARIAEASGDFQTAIDLLRTQIERLLEY